MTFGMLFHFTFLFFMLLLYMNWSSMCTNILNIYVLYLNLSAQTCLSKGKSACAVWFPPLAWTLVLICSSSGEHFMQKQDLNILFSLIFIFSGRVRSFHIWSVMKSSGSVSLAHNTIQDSRAQMHNHTLWGPHRSCQHLTRQKDRIPLSLQRYAPNDPQSAGLMSTGQI